MITDAAKYYGAVLQYVVDRHAGGSIIKRIDPAYPGAYLVNGILPLYIKFSTSRRSPWNFNFHRSHQEMQSLLAMRHGECICVLVCGRDGIVALRHTELRAILDENFEEQESVTVRRKLNEMYQVRGRDGKLGRRVARNSLEDILTSYSNKELKA